MKKFERRSCQRKERERKKSILLKSFFKASYFFVLLRRFCRNLFCRFVELSFCRYFLLLVDQRKMFEEKLLVVVVHVWVNSEFLFLFCSVIWFGVHCCIWYCILCSTPFGACSFFFSEWNIPFGKNNVSLRCNSKLFNRR